MSALTIEALPEDMLRCILVDFCLPDFPVLREVCRSWAVLVDNYLLGCKKRPVFDSAYLVRNGHVGLLREVWSRLSVFRGLFTTMERWTKEAMQCGQEDVLRFCLLFNPQHMTHYLHVAYDRRQLRSLKVAAEFGWSDSAGIYALEWMHAMESGDLQFFQRNTNPVIMSYLLRAVVLPSVNAIDIAEVLVANPHRSTDRGYMFVAAARAGRVDIMKLLGRPEAHFEDAALRAAIAADQEAAAQYVSELAVRSKEALYALTFSGALYAGEWDTLKKLIPRMAVRDQSSVDELARRAAESGQVDMLQIAFELGASHKAFLLQSAVDYGQVATINACLDRMIPLKEFPIINGHRGPDVLRALLRANPPDSVLRDWARVFFGCDNAECLAIVLDLWDRAQAEKFIDSFSKDAYRMGNHKVLRLISELRPSIDKAELVSHGQCPLSAGIVALLLEWQLPITWARVFLMTTQNDNFELLKLVHEHGKVVWPRPGDVGDTKSAHFRDLALIYAYCAGDKQYVQDRRWPKESGSKSSK